MQPDSRLRLAALIVAQVVAMWAAFAVLAQSIDWPQSLRLPAAVMLPLITQHATAVAVGYSAYLLHALLLVPIALLVPRALPGTSRFSTAILVTGSAAAIFKVLGIARWLVLMPVLARHYGAAGDDTARAMIATVYEGLNAYLGGVGELFGVGLLLWQAWLIAFAGSLVVGARRGNLALRHVGQRHTLQA